MRTFSHCARVRRSVPCTNFLSGATGGRPVFLRSSMPELSVTQEGVASVALLCHNNAMQTVVKTLKLRIKDKHAGALRRMARDVNMVWNFANETSSRAIRERGKWLSAYDLQKLTAGYSKCDDVTIGSGTVQLVCVEYATRRKQSKKARLNWRVSNPKSPKYSLGWIPFKGGHAKYKSGQIQFGGHKFSLWDSYGLSRFELRSGSFNEDSRGRWYFNVAVEVEVRPSQGTSVVGIDLGLKECATTSDGSVEGPRGQRDLGIRRWTCSCGAEHDRDVNAAKNIARFGLESLAVGAPA